MLVCIDEYRGKLTVQLLADSINGHFVLDVYNPEGSRLRFKTDVGKENLPKYFLQKATFEDWIETLLERVIKGEYKKHVWLPFSTIVLDDKTLKNMIELTKVNYRDSEDDMWR